MEVDSHRRLPSFSGQSESALQQNLTRLDITTANAGRDRQWQDGRPSSSGGPGYFTEQSAGVPPPPQATTLEQPITPRKNKRQAWYGGPVGPAQGTQPMHIAQRTSPEDSGSSDGVPTPSASQGTEYHPVIVNANGMIEAQAPGAVIGDDQQKVHYAPSQSKPEPIRTDSGFQSYVHTQGAPPQTYILQAGHDPRFAQGYMQAPDRPNNDMGRLEALVAVATSEGRAVEHRS